MIIMHRKILSTYSRCETTLIILETMAVLTTIGKRIPVTTTLKSWLYTLSIEVTVTSIS